MSIENGSTVNPTKDIVAAYAEQLGIKIKTATSQIIAAEKNYETQILARDYAICCLVKAQKTASFYSNLDNCVLTTAQEDGDLIKGKIADYIKKGEDLGKQLKDNAKSLKDLKKVISDIAKKAQDLKESMNEEKRCNKQIFNDLMKGLGAGELTETCKSVADMTVGMLDTANKSYDAAIDIAGLIKFSNVSGLQGFGEQLKELIDKLRKDAEENIKSAGKNKEEAQTKLTKGLKTLSVVKFADFSAEAKGKGLACINDKACEYVEQFEHLDEDHAKNPCPDTPEEAGLQLMEICKKVIKNKN